MEKINLKSKSREVTGRKVRSLRREGSIPAVLYGHGVENLNLSLNAHDFDKIFKQAGSNTIIDLNVDEGKDPKNVLIHKLDHDPVTGQIRHVDLYAVKMTTKLKAQVPVHFTGEASAVHQLGGTLLTHKDELEVECLPGDLPQSFEVSLDVLDSFEASIHVSDIAAPEGVEILDDAEDTVAVVEPPRSEEEMAELDKPIEEALPEEEGAEPAEGEGEAVTGEASEETEVKE